MPIPLSQYADEVPPSNGHSAAIWRTIALCLFASMASCVTAFFTIGTDNVKHSEIDNIMATRAPYMKDKEHIQEKFDTLNARVSNLERDSKTSEGAMLSRIEQLEIKMAGRK